MTKKVLVSYYVGSIDSDIKDPDLITDILRELGNPLGLDLHTWKRVK